MNNKHNNSLDTLEIVWIPFFLLVMAAEAMFFSGLNQTSFVVLNEWFRLVPDTVWAHITVLGDALVALALLSLLAFRHPRLLSAGLLAALLATIATHSLKDLLAMERPLSVLGEQVHLIGIALHNFSMPSGHTITTFTLAGVYALVLQRERLTALLFVAALIIGFSRVAVGVHWPADILAGAAIGWLCAWAGWRLAEHWCWSHSRWGQRFLALLFLLFAALLFRLDTGYPQAVLMQQGIAGLAVLASLFALWQAGRHRH